jgi:RHS repeat-associated protein
VADSNTWPKKQTTRDHLDNGKLKTLVTKNGAGAVTESHTVGYETGGVYVDGNRVTDRYVLARAAARLGVTTCLPAAPCDAAYDYDARDRLTRHQLRAGKEIRYTLDQLANLLGDTTVRAGNVTTENRFGTTTTRKYTANQLTSATLGITTTKYWYTPDGNLDCVTKGAGCQADCSPTDAMAASADLVTDYTYDYLSRVASQRSYAGGTRTDRADYVYDALDRTVTEAETHAAAGKNRSTGFTYQGLSTLVTQETQTGGTNPKTKTYGYDAYGHRLSMTDKVTGSTGDAVPFSYAHDVHGSVSQLLSDAGAVRASYGYDAYGGQDAPDSDPQALTTGEPDNQTPFNPYRYSGHRIDSGTATSPTAAAGLDMGARRYGPDTGRYLQADLYHGALANLGLATDPLTQNRYALAGANPISFVEADGHRFYADGYGGGSASPTPAPTPGSPAAFRIGEDNADSGGSTAPPPAPPAYPEDVVPNEVAGAPDTWRKDWIYHRLQDLQTGIHTQDDANRYNQTKAAYCAEFTDSWCQGPTRQTALEAGLEIAAFTPWGRALKALRVLTRLGRGTTAASAGSRLPGLAISDTQFGAKVGKHATDFGLDPADPAARAFVRRRITDIHANPTEVRQGPWNPKGGGGTDYFFYRQGEDVVVTRNTGDFVTILKGGESNSWFQGAGLVWP